MTVISDIAYDALPPAEQARYARIRDADQVPHWTRRTDAPAPAPGARLTEAEFDRLTVGERYNYCKQFPAGAR
jgi:hypothetical protein